VSTPGMSVLVSWSLSLQVQSLSTWLSPLTFLVFRYLS